MTKTINILTGLVLVLAAALMVAMSIPRDSHANVITQGIIPQVATSSLMSVGPSNAVTLFAKASNCTSRVISTLGQPIMLSFSPLLTPNASTGHVQAASTTVAYDNAVYGCGAITAYGFNASTSITVTGLQQ